MDNSSAHAILTASPQPEYLSKFFFFYLRIAAALFPRESYLYPKEQFKPSRMILAGKGTMLSSMMSTVSSTMSTTSVLGMFATLGVSEISVITVICLIVLLSASEILSASKIWNGRLAETLNMAIIPMVITFFAIVAFKVMDVIK
jgi:hypothetical protein